MGQQSSQHIPPMWLIFHGSWGNSRVAFVALGAVQTGAGPERESV